MKKNFINLTLLMVSILLVANSSLFADGEIVGKYPYTYGNVGMAFDKVSNVAYIYHEAEHTVYKLDGTDFTPLDTIPVPFSLSHADYGWSMTFDGTNLWLACPWSSEYPGLYAMDPATGDSVGFVDPGVGGILRGVDWDGTNFWIGTNDGGTGMIYEISPTGEQLSSFSVAEVGWLNQLCIAEDEIWMNDDRLYFTSYTMDGTFLQKINSQIPGAWGQLSHDLTFDGNDVLNVCWDQNIIYKMYVGKGHGEYLQAPTDISTVSDENTPTSIDLSWTNPTLYLNGNAGTTQSVNIYDANTGVLLGSSTGEQFTVSNLTPVEYYSFYLVAVSDANREGVSSKIIGMRAGGPIQGDVINEVPLGQAGWVAMVWDSNYVWSVNEQDNTWYKLDKENGAVLKTFANPEGAPSNTQGAAWSKYNTIYANQHSAGSGEVWELDTNGTVVNFWPTDIVGASGATNRQRGLAIYNDIVWIGRGNLDGVPNYELFRFDLDGVAMESAFVDTPIAYSGGMEWVNGQLWVNDRGSNLIRIYDYDGSDSLHQVMETNQPHGNMWGLAFTGSEVLTAAWAGTESLFWLKPGIPTSVDDNKGNIVNSFELSQNYPNPFNPSTIINYSIIKSDMVNLTVYNMLGQKVATLVNELKSVGNHSIEWNGKNQYGKDVASGIYFYKIITGQNSSVKKMMLLR
ncbi:MAG: T9SS type A sorting domain-containing protein [Bacteroidota bacterium]